MGTLFDQVPITLALTPSVLSGHYMRESVEKALSEVATHRFQFVEPACSAIAGATLMALEHAGVTIDEPVLRAIGEHPKSALP